MKKKKAIATTILTGILALGISIRCIAAGADDIQSHGTLIHQSGTESVAIYSSDISLLASKIFTIPDTVYDPLNYTHLHTWVYKDINDQTHTKYCTDCGVELVNNHTASEKESCSITYGGDTYSGYLYTCACGYQWTVEAAHTYVYTYKDEALHTISCALAGTDYCTGCSEIDETHTFYLTACEDGEHHTATCTYCGYEVTEECDFTYDYESDGENTIICYCECGNSITEVYNDGYQYVSNGDGTHQVPDDDGNIEDEDCDLIADPDTYDEEAGTATYTCPYCGYSVTDSYTPDTSSDSDD